MSQNLKIDEYETYHRSVGWVQQAYYFFFSCLPSEGDEYPKKINGIYFMDFNHVKVYENELSYSFVIRIFGVLEELCNNLGLADKEVPKIIEQSLNISEDTKSNFKHLRNLRHVITHGNGVGEIIRSRYVNYIKDHNGDLLIKIEELEGFTSVITAIAKELNAYSNTRT